MFSRDETKRDERRYFFLRAFPFFLHFRAQLENIGENVLIDFFTDVDFDFLQFI